MLFLTVSGPAVQTSQPTFASALLGQLILPSDPRTQQRPAVEPLQRLFRLVAVWPSVYEELFGGNPQISEQSLRQLGISWQGSVSPAELVLGAALLAQRGKALRDEQQVYTTGKLEYQPQQDPVAQAAVEQLPSAFVKWATEQELGFGSIAGFERRMRDVNPFRYTQAAQQAGLQPLNDQQLLANERPLVDARMLKDVHRIWKQLPEGTKATLLKIGVRIPEPWSVYSPDPQASVSASALRLLTFVAYIRRAAATALASTSPTGSPTYPVTLWTMSTELLPFRPPSDIIGKFRDPSGPDGFVPVESFLAAIWLAKNIAARNAQEERQELVQALGERAVRWLEQEAPQPSLIAQAVAFPKEATAARAFSRVVRHIRDYYKNLHIGDRAVFCGQGWKTDTAITHQRFTNAFTPLAPPPPLPTVGPPPHRGGPPRRPPVGPPTAPPRTPPTTPPLFPPRTPPTEGPPTRVPREKEPPVRFPKRQETPPTRVPDSREIPPSLRRNSNNQGRGSNNGQQDNNSRNNGRTAFTPPSDRIVMPTLPVVPRTLPPRPPSPAPITPPRQNAPHEIKRGWEPRPPSPSDLILPTPPVNVRPKLEPRPPSPPPAVRDVAPPTNVRIGWEPRPPSPADLTVSPSLPPRPPSPPMMVSPGAYRQAGFGSDQPAGFGGQAPGSNNQPKPPSQTRTAAQLGDVTTSGLTYGGSTLSVNQPI